VELQGKTVDENLDILKELSIGKGIVKVLHVGSLASIFDSRVQTHLSGPHFEIEQYI